MSLLVKIPSMSYIDFWTTYSTQVQLTTVAENKLLPSITIAGLPPDATIIRAIMILKYRTIENTSTAANGVSGDQNIRAKKAVDGSWVKGIALGGGECSVPATTRETGDVMMGTDDVSGQVPANDAVMSFRWTNGLAAQNNLNFNDVQVGLRIWFTI